jgi:hypothetical protein
MINITCRGDRQHKSSAFLADLICLPSLCFQPTGVADENIKCTITMFSVNSRSCGKHLVTVSCHLMIFPTIRNWENHSDKDGILSLDDFNNTNTMFFGNIVKPPKTFSVVIVTIDGFSIYWKLLKP